MSKFRLAILILIVFGVYFSCTKTGTEISYNYVSPPNFQDITLPGTHEQPLEFTFTAPPPNPFSPSSIFNYTLPYSSTVRLDVLNAAEQKVDSTDFSYRNPGVYKFIWNATAFKSGIYYFQLHACDSTITLKTSLLK